MRWRPGAAHAVLCAAALAAMPAAAGCTKAEQYVPPTKVTDAAAGQQGGLPGPGPVPGQGANQGGWTPSADYTLPPGPARPAPGPPAPPAPAPAPGAGSAGDGPNGAGPGTALPANGSAPAWDAPKRTGYPSVTDVTCTGKGPWTLAFTVNWSASTHERVPQFHLAGGFAYIGSLNGRDLDWDFSPSCPK